MDQESEQLLFEEEKKDLLKVLTRLSVRKIIHPWDFFCIILVVYLLIKFFCLHRHHFQVKHPLR